MVAVGRMGRRAASTRRAHSSSVGEAEELNEMSDKS
jgi:hypothetical protein